MSAHICDATCLPLCKYRQAGSGGVGRPKANPSPRHRTAREQLHAREHTSCECPGCVSCTDAVGRCTAKPTEINHVGGRGLGGTSSRDLSPLEHLCSWCHRSYHAGNRIGRGVA